MLTLAEKDKEQEQETGESEDSKVKVGDLYIEWKRKTLNTQVKLYNKPNFYISRAIVQLHSSPQDVDKKTCFF